MKFVNYCKVYAGLFLLILYLLLGGLAILFVQQDWWPGVLTGITILVVLALFSKSWTEWALHLGKGQKAFKNSDYAEARDHLHRALHAVERYARLDPRRGVVLDWLGQVYRAEGRFDEAEPFLQEAVTIQEQVWGHLGTFTQISRINLANLYLDLARFAQARQLYQQVFDIRIGQRKAQHLDLGILNNNLGKSFTDEERYAEGEPYFRRALEIFRARRRATHPIVGLCLNNLAYDLARQGKIVEAEPLAEEALRVIARKPEPSPLYALAHFNLGRIRLLQDRLDEAEQLTRTGLAAAERIFHSQHPGLADGLALLAEILEAQHKAPEAEKIARQVLAIRQDVLVAAHPARARAVEELARLVRRRDPAEADALDAEARRLRSCRQDQL